MKLKVEYMDTDALVPYAHNAKEHPDWQVDQIAASIDQFGMNDPVGVWTRPDGEVEIVEGHGRVLALKKLGIDKCPVIKLDHLDDDARRAYVHVHNQTTLTSGLDWGVLDTEFIELPDFNWEDFGFDAVDLADARGATDDFKSDFTDEELSAYSEEPPLKAYNVILCCLNDAEQEYVAGLLGVEGQPKRLYMVSELMGD